MMLEEKILDLIVDHIKKHGNIDLSEDVYEINGLAMKLTTIVYDEVAITIGALLLNRGDI